MGWIWSSSTPPQSKPQQENLQDHPPSPTPFADSATPPPLSPPPSSSAPPPPPSSSHHDSSDSAETPKSLRSSRQKEYEFADAEFRAFIRELAAEEAAASLPHNQPFANSPFKKLFGRSNKTPSTTTPPTSSSYDDNDVDETASTPPITDLLPPHSFSITPSNIYPTTMSCRAAFDAAFYCQSLGGQFNAVYHYGSVRDCSPLWSQFWFCVKTNRRAMSEEERQGKITEWYQKREETKYRQGQGPSSEDVWVQRTTMLMGAFQQDWDAAVAEDETRMRMKREAAGAVEEERKGEGGG